MAIGRVKQSIARQQDELAQREHERHQLQLELIEYNCQRKP